MAIEETKQMTMPRVLIPRHVAFMELLWDSLARKFELANLTMDYLTLSRNFLTVWAKAKRRKGKGQQPKKISPRAKRALNEYLEIRKELARPECPFVFVTCKGTQWKPESVGSFFKRLCARLPFTIYCHTYRSGGATWALESGILSDRYVMLQGGWESFDVFADYTIEASLNKYGEMLWGTEEEETEDDAKEQHED